MYSREDYAQVKHGMITLAYPQSGRSSPAPQVEPAPPTQSN